LATKAIRFFEGFIRWPENYLKSANYVNNDGFKFIVENQAGGCNFAQQFFIWK
jgi:hypothetical protein